jgi:phosphate transport system permease protein
MSTPPDVSRENEQRQEQGETPPPQAGAPLKRLPARKRTTATPDGRPPTSDRGQIELQRGIPERAPWYTFAGAAAVMALLFLAVGWNWALFFIGTAVLGGASLYAWSRAVEGRRRATDRGVTVVVSCAFALALVPLVSLLWTVVKRGAPRFDGAFFTESMRGVVSEGGGAAHAIIGTLLITGVATLISVPIGILAAVYLEEYGKGRLKRYLTFFVDVMTGIPSIVAGLFAFALFSLFLGPGVRLGVMGSVALSVLMIPIVVRSTEEMLRIVPQGLREASYALGVPKWRTITKVVLPTALAGIVTGVMLAIARIIGETAPLLITTGVISSINTNPFDGRMPNLAVFAFNEYKSPGVPPEPSFDRAWTAALVLILIVMALNFGARFVYRRFGTELR